MRFNTFINNVKCKEWGLNANQGAMFDLFNQLHAWADEIMIDGKVYYHISRAKIIREIPLFYSKPDTVYRHFKKLAEKGLILYTKQGHKDLIRLTTKGKKWNSDLNPNSEINPKELGNRSGKNSDSNPTDNNISNNKINIIDRAKIFEEEVFETNKILEQKLPDSELKIFVNYWTEAGEKDKKMVFEKCLTWNLKSRMQRWQLKFAGSYNGKQYYQKANEASIVPKMNFPSNP